MESKKFNPQEHMMDLKGKQYLQVMWRLVWFREEHPDWHIQTEIIEHQFSDHAVIKAWIWNPEKETILAEAHGSESVKDFKDYLEKAETKAVGRALAMLGYGTQFAPELDEEERIVDSPVAKKAEPKEKTYKCSCCGTTITKEIGGKKHKGKILCMPCYEKLNEATD